MPLVGPGQGTQIETLVGLDHNRAPRRRTPDKLVEESQHFWRPLDEQIIGRGTKDQPGPLIEPRMLS
jgi:hypothetical protein